jgi:hypothetical protein
MDIELLENRFEFRRYFKDLGAPPAPAPRERGVKEVIRT